MRVTRPLYVPEPSEDRHAPAALRTTASRGPEPGGVYYEPDEIETNCAFCTLIWAGDGWQHDPGCLLRALG